MTALITATGAVTSLGFSAASSCAAIRAGLSRPHTVDLTLVEAESQEPISLTGHPVAGYSDGFQLVGRWVRLARGAVADLLAQLGIPPAGDAGFWNRTGLVAVTAHPDDEVFLADKGGALSAIEADYLGVLRRTLRLPFAASAVDLIPRGHAGTAAAVEVALARIGDGLDRVLVLAADSLIDPVVLQKLAGVHRLKTDEEPTGLMPGEAGAAFLVESPTSARRRGAAACAQLIGAASGREPGDPSSGRALATCLSTILAARSARGAFDGEIIFDLNGEGWRAREWGTALVRLGSRLARADLRLPATSLGDTGAASGALAICCGAHLLRRGVARGDVLALSRSEAGEVGCVGLAPSA